MVRRYTNVEPKPVMELVPGDQVVTQRTIAQVVRTSDQVTVTFDDGTTQLFDLAGDPAVEVVATKSEKRS